jgi:hypothetical protein
LEYAKLSFFILNNYLAKKHQPYPGLRYNLVLPLHTKFFIFENTKISIFGSISKFLKLIVFG